MLQAWNPPSLALSFFELLLVVTKKVAVVSGEHLNLVPKEGLAVVVVVWSLAVVSEGSLKSKRVVQ